MGKQSFQLPAYSILEQIRLQLIGANQSAEPCVSWGEGPGRVAVRRFQNMLFLDTQSESMGGDAPAPYEELSWPVAMPLDLPAGMGTLTLVEVAANGLRLTMDTLLVIRFRQGGEKVKPAGRKTRSLRKIFQDYGVPPWRRNSYPLVFLDDQLIAVGDLFIVDGSLHEQATQEGEKLYRIQWEKADIRCGD